MPIRTRGDIFQGGGKEEGGRGGGGRRGEGEGGKGVVGRRCNVTKRGGEGERRRLEGVKEGKERKEGR